MPVHVQVELTPRELSEFLLHAALVRPVFIWGQPGIGKSALVEAFAAECEMPCVSLLGSQLAPEDLIGVPQITPEGTSRFCPPSILARDEPYVLFLDELNASSHEIQKAFYSLIHERRLGEFHLPEGSVIIGAGNRAQDSAIVRPMSSALINRMVHVGLRVSPRDWLDWARAANLHPWVIDHIERHPDHLSQTPPKEERVFTTPRAWHAVSDLLRSWGATDESFPMETLERIAHGTLGAVHAGRFVGLRKQRNARWDLDKILSGERGWPRETRDRDVLYVLAESLQSRLRRDLPADKDALGDAQRTLAHQAKAALANLAGISLEAAQLVMAADENGGVVLPGWFAAEVIRDIPRLVESAA